MISLNMQNRMLLVASLISSGLLIGCESNPAHLERFYQPAATHESVSAAPAQPRATPPRLVYSPDPDRDGRLLGQHGYVLIGTTSFNGAPDLLYLDRAVVTQGQKVGAAIVLLKTHSYSTVTSCCASDPAFVGPHKAGVSYFASYWTKSDAAKMSEPQ
jgi:hypothetical protein